MKLFSNRTNPMILSLPINQLLIQLFLKSYNILSCPRLMRNILNILDCVFGKLYRRNHNIQKSIQIWLRILSIFISVQKNLFQNFLLSLVSLLMHIHYFLNGRIKSYQGIYFQLFRHYKNL